MTSIEILNLDSLLSCNESLLKFKNLHLFEEIKNNYILLLRKEENKKSNYINDEKFIYFIRKDRDYITSELNEIVETYYSLFFFFFSSNTYYVEKLEKIEVDDVYPINCLYSFQIV